MHKRRVRKDHPYRKILDIIDLRKRCIPLQKHNRNPQAQHGYRIVPLFKALLLQFIEELSDRELPRFLEENNAAKYFYAHREHKLRCRRRSAIEAVIGHLKSEHRLSRNYLGTTGDSMNALLSGIGFNFRLLLREVAFFARILCSTQCQKF